MRDAEPRRKVQVPSLPQLPVQLGSSDRPRHNTGRLPNKIVNPNPLRFALRFHQAKFELQTWKCNCGTVNEVSRVNCLRCRAGRMGLGAQAGTVNTSAPQHPYAGGQPGGNRAIAIGRASPPQGGVLPKLNGVDSPEVLIFFCSVAPLRSTLNVFAAG